MKFRQTVPLAALAFVIFCGVSYAEPDKPAKGQSPAPEPEAAVDQQPEMTAEQALNVQEIAPNIFMGGLPSAEGYKRLLETKDFTRVICVVPESDDTTDAPQIAADAGLGFERIPIPVDFTAELIVLDWDALNKVIAALEPAQGVTYVADRYGYHEVGIVDFAYQIRVAQLQFADAIKHAMERGLRTHECSGIIREFKRYASGLERLPVVEGLPIGDRELLEPGEMVPVGGQKLNVKKYGSGPPIYVIHGGPGETHKPMRPYLDVLQVSNTVVYYDQRGCGLSTKPQFEEAYSLSRLAKELDGLREALGHDKISLFAHSTGAAVAIEYASKYRDRVDKLVIMCAWARSADVSPHTGLISRMFTGKRLEALIELLTKLRREGRTYNDREMALLLRLAYPFNFFGDMSREFARAWGRVSEVSAFTNIALSPHLFNDYDITEKLGELKNLPTLVVAGEYDIITPPSVVKPLADGIEGARFEVIPLCGHYPFVEKHEEIIKLISDFLKGEAAAPKE